MPPKNTRKAHEKGEDADQEDMIASPLASDAGSYASSISSVATSSISLSSAQLESILVATSKANLDSSAKLMESNQKAMEHSSAKLMESTQKAMADLIASLSPGFSGTRPPRPVQVKPPKWSDDDTPYDYFSKYEKAMAHNGVDKAEWGQLLPVYLAGRAQVALAQVDTANLDDYDQVKSTLLNSLGDTPSSADRKWWSLSRLPGEEPGSFYLRVRAIGLRRLHGLTSVGEITEKVILSRFLSLLSADCYAAVSQRQPESGLEASRMVQDFEDTRAYTRRRQHWKDNPHHQRREPVASSRSGSPTHSSGAAAKEGNGSQGPSAGAQGGAKPKGEKNRKPIICHNCNEPGHIRPNCPNRLRRVKSPVQSDVMVVSGWLAGCLSDQLRVDTGADRTVVRADFVPEAAYTGDVVGLDTWRGNDCSEHKLARLTIRVGKVEVQSTVAVVEQLDYPALLGSDLGEAMTRELMNAVVAKLDAEEKPVTSVEPIRVTRAQAKKIAADERENDIASAQAECSPVPLHEVLDFPDSYFEQDEVFDATVVPVDELSEWPVSEQVELPLPDIGCNGVKLAEEQKGDSSLSNLWQKGEKEEKGYTFDHGVLVHHTSDGVDDQVVRVVVPTGRRQQVLQMGHSGSIAGHFGVKKTHAKISRHFVWPGLWTQVKAYVRTCGGCQLAAKQHKSRAPLQPLPCVGEPFQKVAFDLVGPLPRSSSGNKYVLTAMCLFTKFPEAIPLKKVDNATVLDAMMQIFARYGMPCELLTDQGSVFTSKLTALMCKTFGIVKLRTSPYHPQSDGALERWHACLKGMIKKGGGKLCEWDRQLKFLLFAYRDTPHCVTGFSPFLLMFGRDVRGPLQFLKTSWIEEDVDGCSVGDWLVSVKAKMGEMSELVSDRELKAKATMKSFYDRSAAVKAFKEGAMVLVKKPILHGKMDCSWEGPFEIERRVSPVTYAIKLPGRSTKAKILHCNLLKEWHTPAEKLHRVMVVREEESESESSPGLKLGRDDFVPSVAEQAMLEAVLEEYRGVLCVTPGRTEAAQLSIRTGNSEPVRSHPYRIPPKWKEEVKLQLDQLLALGIIEPSSSPWSSSLVIVSKKDGGVRTCVDYRAVNAVTDPDPYQMPLIEEILEMLATAKFISKVDLTKGFHQIPINQADRAKTAFCTPWGKFQFCFMPFGLRNGPAVFQRLMDFLLHKDKEYSQVYIDDIAIFSATWEEHCHHIGVVLSRLQEAGLTANASKCQWAQTQVEFLGHVVGKGKVCPADLKVKAVRDFHMPRTKKGVRQFLGLTGYYRRFIPEFAEHSYHLTEATRKAAPDRVVFSDLLYDEFMYLKNVLCSLPTLTLPVPADSFILQTDASGVGLGAVLSVVREDVELPVAYFSKKLLPRERRYSASELEGLAVVVAVQHFQPYLITHPFVIETDHKALVFLSTAHHQNGRLARWAMSLQPYAFTVRYRPGPLNVNADVLSRLFVDHEQAGGPQDFSALPGVSDSNKGGGRCYESTPSQQHS